MNLTLRGLAPIVAPDRCPIYLWGVTRSTVTAALILKKRNHRNLTFINVDNFSDLDGLRELGFSQVTSFASVPRGSLILYSAELRPSPTITAQEFTLTHGAQDLVSQEFRYLSAIEIHKIAVAVEDLGWSDVGTYLHHVIYHVYNCRIPNSVVIGEDTTLAYGGIGVVLHKDTILGRNVKIGQNATLGAKAGGHGPPVIGDSVFIGPNSVLLGGPVGENSIIGAGSVVLQPVERNSIVAGNPARLIRKIREN